MKRIAARDAELDKLRASNPRPKLWKRFDTPRFGAGRNVRFGDLNGDGVPEMLFAQNIPRVRGSWAALTDSVMQVAQWYGADDADEG